MILKSQLANKLYLCAIKDNSADKKFVIYGTGPSAKELYEILMLFDIKAIFFIDEDNQVDVYENVDVYRPEDLIYFCYETGCSAVS